MRERLLADLPVTERRLDVDGVDTAVLEGGDGAPLVLRCLGARAQNQTPIVCPDPSGPASHTRY